MKAATIKLSDRQPVPALKAPLIAFAAEDMFQDVRFKLWKKGEISNPKWLKREAGHDFISINAESELPHLEKYLAQADNRLAVLDYNCFSTGMDKAGNEMICLYDTADNGDSRKVAIIICSLEGVALQVVGLCDKYCAGGGEHPLENNGNIHPLKGKMSWPAR